MPSKLQKEEAWKDAKKRCRLNDEDIMLAKKLGMTPKTLIKNIPNSREQWKSPVKDWIRTLALEKKLIEDDKVF